MKKSKLISIFLIILIALFATGCTKKVSNLTGSGKESGDKLENVKGNIMDVIKMGKSVKCTGSYSNAEGSMEMVVYAAGKKSYSEMEMDAGEDGTLTSYSIVDGEWMYTWTDMEGMSEEAQGFGMNMAFKMNIADMEEMGKDLPDASDYKAGDQQGSQAFQKDFDYKCKAWIPDNSKFVPPSDIEFMDMSQTMKDFSNAAESGDMKDIMGSGCAACEMIPDAAEQAECKAELGC